MMHFLVNAACGMTSTRVILLVYGQILVNHIENFIQ